MYISKKTMRQKDFAALKAKKPGFKKFKLGKSMLYRTKRGWFLSSPNEETKKYDVGEISIMQAQLLLDSYNINYQTGW